jgi:hypothetical protein
MEKLILLENPEESKARLKNKPAVREKTEIMHKPSKEEMLRRLKGAWEFDAMNPKRKRRPRDEKTEIMHKPSKEEMISHLKNAYKLVR